MNDTPPTGTDTGETAASGIYAHAAPMYWDRGWLNPLPIPPLAKDPPPDGYTGRGGVDPSYPDVDQWRELRPGHNIALRMLPGLIGLDVDDYDDKHGGDTLIEAQTRWGVLPPPTWMTTSRDDGVSGIRFYHVPEDIEFCDSITFPDQGLGHIEIIQRHHRYAMVWPSIHPSGRPYRWVNEYDGKAAGFIPRPEDFPWLPEEWIEKLTATPNVTTAGFILDTDSVIDGALTSGPPSPGVSARLVASLTALHNGTGARHDATRNNVLTLLRKGIDGEPGVHAALTELGDAFVAAVTADGTRTRAVAEQEFMRMMSNTQAAELLAQPDPWGWAKPALSNGQSAQAQPGGVIVTTSATETIKADAPTPASTENAPTPKLWKATDLQPSMQPRWLAKNRIQTSAVNLIVGDEGIGKSLLWVWIAAAITTGTERREFGIPARDPGTVVVVATEDDWSTAVRPRLEVAGADFDRIEVVCTDPDGSGSPTFPRDIPIIAAADSAPAMIVVDAWLDTVPRQLNIKDPHDARIALHPWKELATTMSTAVTLLCHTNRTDSPSARDRYAATMELRKKARATLYAQRNEDGQLVVGPEKMNAAPASTVASVFAIKPIQKFEPTDDSDGTVPLLVYVKDSDRTAQEHLTDSGSDEPGGNPVKRFVHTYLTDHGGEVLAKDVIKAGRQAGFSEDELIKARQRHRKPKIRSRKASFGGGWVWAIDVGGDGDSAEDGTKMSAPPCSSSVPSSPSSESDLSSSYPLCAHCGKPMTGGQTLVHEGCKAAWQTRQHLTNTTGEDQ